MGEVFRRTKNGKLLGYSLRWYEAGRRRVMASKQASHAEAKRMLIEIEARVARGEAGIPERRSWSTVAQLVEKFLREYDRPRVKNIDRYRAMARSVFKLALPHIGALSVAEIQSADVIRTRDLLRRKYSAASVKSVLSFLSVMFSWAMRKGLSPANPCKGVERPAVRPTLDFLTKEEVRIFLDKAEERASSSLIANMLHIGSSLAIYTGLRKGELFGLRWSDLDLESRRLTVMRSYQTTPKGGAARHLRLSKLLVPILKNWHSLCPPSPDGLVLPLGLGPSKVGTRDAMLGIHEFMISIGLREVKRPWHLLRHTFASHFIMSGGNILTLQKILGHSDLKMTLIYAHLAPEFLDREFDRLKF